MLTDTDGCGPMLAQAYLQHSGVLDWPSRDAQVYDALPERMTLDRTEERVLNGGRPAVRVHDCPWVCRHPALHVVVVILALQLIAYFGGAQLLGEVHRAFVRVSGQHGRPARNSVMCSAPTMLDGGRGRVDMVRGKVT